MEENRLQKLRALRRSANAEARRELALGNIANAVQAQAAVHQLSSEIAAEKAQEFNRNSRLSLMITAQNFREREFEATAAEQI